MHVDDLQVASSNDCAGILEAGFRCLCDPAHSGGCTGAPRRERGVATPRRVAAATAPATTAPEAAATAATATANVARAALHKDGVGGMS